MTSMVPWIPAGLVAVTCVGEFTTKLVAAESPKDTAERPVKFVPVIVTAVPPATEPDAGLMLLMTGACDVGELIGLWMWLKCRRPSPP